MSELPTSKPLRILIVDDECPQYHGLTKLLEKRGHEHVCCTSVKEALSCFETKSFDIVVLDIGFPDMEPMEVIRSMNYFTDAKVICITGSDDPKLRKTCLARGAFDFVIKGVTEHGLYDSILKAAASAHPEEEEFDRELVVNRKMAVQKRDGFWNKYKAVLAIIAATLSVVSITGAGTIMFVRWIYNNGAADTASNVRIDAVIAQANKEVGERVSKDLELAKLIGELTLEFTHRKEIVDKAFLENEKRDAESKQDRETINKRIDSYSSDLSTLRKELNDGFIRVQDNQNRMYQALINRGKRVDE